MVVFFLSTLDLSSVSFRFDDNLASACSSRCCFVRNDGFILLMIKMDLQDDYRAVSSSVLQSSLARLERDIRYRSYDRYS